MVISVTSLVITDTVRLVPAREVRKRILEIAWHMSNFLVFYRDHGLELLFVVTSE